MVHVPAGPDFIRIYSDDSNGMTARLKSPDGIGGGAVPEMVCRMSTLAADLDSIRL